ncbi:MAG: S-layer homology domain-containing protein [Pseudanabaena sp.]|nr:MAG: S-layer homology domain-containing protein [Pseudanabaena sp.]
MRFTTSLYLTAFAISASIASLPAISSAQSNPSSNTNFVAQQPAPVFSDIAGNPYESYILEATKLGIVKGFPDGTFRPQQAVTREEAISMIVDALNTVVPINVNEQPTRSVRPYLDIKPSRWSAAKINWAQWNFSVLQAGSFTGNFRPTAPIKRNELVNVLRSAAQNLQLKLGKSSFLAPTQPPIEFTDVVGFDKQLTLQMSAYCGVASPLNAKGTRFAPNQPASRAFTAAAIVRTINCVKNAKK